MSYVFTCFCISRWFRIHSTSAYNLAGSQVVILEGCKLGNYLGGGGRKLCYTQCFHLRKTQYCGQCFMLSMYVMVLLSCCCFFLMAKDEFLFMLLRLPMCVFMYDHSTICSFI